MIKKRREGELNVSPELSPDGSKVIFFSERDLFSIDLFVADAKTGEVHPQDHRHRDQRPHREPAVHCLGRRVGSAPARSSCFLASARGQPVLTIVDVDRGKNEREIAIAERGRGR